jgi:hypothetical protein
MHFHLAAITAILLAASTTAYDCPLAECDACLPAAVRKAPGVGIELANSYG